VTQHQISRTGADQIRSDRIGSDRIRSDQIRSDHRHTRCVLFIALILMYQTTDKLHTLNSSVVTYRTADRHSHNSINYIPYKYLYIDSYHLHSQNTHNNVIFTVWPAYCKFSSCRI